MKRAECIGMLYPELQDKLVVTIMGACAQELYDLGHKENFFYQLPPTGAVVIAAPLKIVNGSGRPLRVIAITPA